MNKLFLLTTVVISTIVPTAHAVSEKHKTSLHLKHSGAAHRESALATKNTAAAKKTVHFAETPPVQIPVTRYIGLPAPATIPQPKDYFLGYEWTRVRETNQKALQEIDKTITAMPQATEENIQNIRNYIEDTLVALGLISAGDRAVRHALALDPKNKSDQKLQELRKKMSAQ